MTFGIKRIDRQSIIQEIVARDYRTAAVFRKYEIPFCCGIKMSLDMACLAQGLDPERIEKELEESIRTISISSSIRFDEWKIPFLVDYIVNVHHAYLKQALPEVLDSLKRFTAGHQKKYPYLEELTAVFQKLSAELLPHISQEEEIIFPYIKQIAHAYNSREEYASLLVRTLSKPVEEMMKHEDEMLVRALRKLRLLTDNYSTPANACGSHRINFSLLQEIDHDLVQHLHLENNILFPKAIQMERELLQMH